MGAPDYTRGDFDALTHGELHQLRRGCGYRKKDSRAAQETRLCAAGALDLRRARDSQGKLPDSDGRRNRIDELHLAFTLDEEAVNEHALWRNLRSKAMRGVTVCSPREGAGEAISAWTSHQCI